MARFLSCSGKGGALCILAFLLLAPGCAPSPKPSNPSETPPPKTTPLPEVAAALAAEAKQKQLILALVRDGSGSIYENRIAPMTEQHLSLLVDLISAHGGELAIALACDDSNQPLLRFRAPQPPHLVAETFNNPPEPTLPDETTINALRLPEARQRYETARARYEELKAEDVQRFQAHQKALAVDQTTVQKATKAFLHKTAPTLNEPANCQATDLHGAMHRVALFFDEESTFEPAPHRVLLVISDGLDTRGKPPAVFENQPELILVNGSGSKGVFEAMPHKAFESLDAAIAFLVHRQH